MDKFIFVCYDHGCGWENLSVQISQRPYCNTLRYTTHNTRTWTEDVFNKLLLKNTTCTNWQEHIPEVSESKKFNVIPSHRPPSELKNVFKNSVFVVINFPTSRDSLLHLHNRIYEKVWLTSHINIQQKLGFCKEEGYNLNSQEKLKKINSALNNAHIHCIMNDLEFTDANVNYLLSKKLPYYGMSFEDDHQTIALEYNNIDIKKLDRLDEICILHR